MESNNGRKFPTESKRTKLISSIKIIHPVRQAVESQTFTYFKANNRRQAQEEEKLGAQNADAYRQKIEGKTFAGYRGHPSSLLKTEVSQSEAFIARLRGKNDIEKQRHILWIQQLRADLAVEQQKQKELQERIRQLEGDIEQSRKRCVICVENDSVWALYKCGHMILCDDCIDKYKDKVGFKCCYCKADVKRFWKIFLP